MITFRFKIENRMNNEMKWDLKMLCQACVRNYIIQKWTFRCYDISQNLIARFGCKVVTAKTLYDSVCSFLAVIRKWLLEISIIVFVIYSSNAFYCVILATFPRNLVLENQLVCGSMCRQISVGSVIMQL